MGDRFCTFNTRTISFCFAPLRELSFTRFRLKPLNEDDPQKNAKSKRILKRTLGSPAFFLRPIKPEKRERMTHAKALGRRRRPMVEWAIGARPAGERAGQGKSAGRSLFAPW